ncbi:MAG TPA: cytochrome c oxidase subunit 3 [Gemmatimonadaceae bacterium]|nr:cytochrome c oxidase subunit 3 [Gemmatimonadaceae bacterium]
MRRRAVIDAAILDDHSFSHHAPIWWGNLLMIFIEGAASALLVVSYYYIRRNFDTWPPPRTLLPELGVSSVNVLVQLVSVIPIWYAAKLAFAHAEPGRIARWLLVVVALGVVAIVLRGFEFAGLHTRYDSNAYGSITWMILSVHLAHLIAGSLETLLIALVLLIGPVERKHYTDTTVMAVYWYFVVGSWVALWLVVFVSVRFI